jgi:carbamoyltransferase
MNYIGISCGFHDAALSVVDDFGNILFAGHSERYSLIKNDPKLSSQLVTNALQYINDEYSLHFYENPYMKVLRQIRTGEKIVWQNLLDRNLIGSNNYNLLKRKSLEKYNHHLSHAAAGFQTSSFNDATVVIVDAIGEFDTITIWNATYDSNGYAQYKKLYSNLYPNSLGLFYSAMTQKVGLKPMDEEYILMGMSAYGKPLYVEQILNEFVFDIDDCKFKENLHVGNLDNFLANADFMDIANSSQIVLELLLKKILEKAQKIGKSSNLVYGGGVALNCLANRLLGNYFDKIWIMPNPGDAGSSLGAACLGFGKKVNFKNAFLGYDIAGEYPVSLLTTSLINDKIVGVASGKAEFGPRALGNRSLLADPRGPDIKDRVNEIKRRQKFRPFAPVILEEMANQYFNFDRGWQNSPYMQTIATCKYPEQFPAICHVDGTSRVQTVSQDNTGIRKLLENWYEKTGCPMLLNTSLNVRGEPMVNTRDDADRFQSAYNIKVYS